VKTTIACEQAPKPVGCYSQGILSKDIVFLSGQILINPATGNIDGHNIEVQTMQIFENIRAILNHMGLNFSHVVKLC